VSEGSNSRNLEERWVESGTEIERTVFLQSSPSPLPYLQLEIRLPEVVDNLRWKARSRVGDVTNALVSPPPFCSC
jgi:hypothetical protein